MDQKTPFVITISRELGCGGAYIGQQLAKELNMYYADHEIIAKAAEQLSTAEKDVELRDEKIESFWNTFWIYSGTASDAFVPHQKMFPPTSFDVFNAESEIIKHIANNRSSVIIGRCGFYVLRDHPNLFSIFLHADPAFRAKRIQDLYKVTEEEAVKKVAQSDKDRVHYISTFTGKKWSDAKQFGLCMDTGIIGIEKSAELILNYLRSK
ncbi:MAG TPA: cytidylate kinase-like family protein [Bacteroidales bacterium]|nr:cytidylate kinase-like family protein [Bacteroidales bacterium]